MCESGRCPYKNMHAQSTYPVWIKINEMNKLLLFNKQMYCIVFPFNLFFYDDDDDMHQATPHLFGVSSCSAPCWRPGRQASAWGGWSACRRASSTGSGSIRSSASPLSSSPGTASPKGTNAKPFITVAVAVWQTGCGVTFFYDHPCTFLTSLRCTQLSCGGI